LAPAENAYQDALRQLRNGDANNAITDAATALLYGTGRRGRCRRFVAIGATVTICQLFIFVNPHKVGSGLTEPHNRAYMLKY
jgi:hypothetical protein